MAGNPLIENYLAKSAFFIASVLQNKISIFFFKYYVARSSSMFSKLTEGSHNYD